MKPYRAMWQTITKLPTPFPAAGRNHVVAIDGMPRPDGTWAGRISFIDGDSVRRTDQETSQPNRAALEYWATGLETVYLEGAFQRAR
jgi:hypothetical protein